MQKETIKNMLNNSIFAQMWKENPQFRKDIKTALRFFGFGVLLFIYFTIIIYGSAKLFSMDKKAQKTQKETKTVVAPESLQNNSMIKWQNTKQR